MEMGVQVARNLFDAAEAGDSAAAAMPVGSEDTQQAPFAVATNGKKTPQEKPPTAASQRAKLAANGFRCALSGISLTPELMSIEHLQPLSRGGKHVDVNVVIVHKIINRMKGELTLQEFIDWCRLVSEHSLGEASGENSQGTSGA